ncbi:hypothetical protein M409DRAFT_56188 [Zasmidium cellare ATCC 36951]|uniref:Uncharacterized protein n=1 Tax=Zasmidium cellare ATCC 36951 TaxID=1080233 RepID=A0A6A6CCA1_ZASCE|nr:uncharacterized protein M409DRAFT_56188 [Zasmidium cellare ATCC 36951]KAF2164814.1 hypothetical protein M409DRAFT_56188 [Zasmidium cellare ATCC 36951]
MATTSYTYSGPSSATVLGPLTTTWTPPAACNVAIVECRSSCAKGFQGQQCVSGLPGAGCSDATTCWPTVTVKSVSFPLGGFGFYSPGTICPSGYSSACSATSGGTSQWSQQFTMRANETAVGCCPSGFGCAWVKGYQSCYSYASSGASVALGTCDRGTTQQFSYMTLPNGGTTVVQESTTNVVNGMETFTVQAPLVEIRWRHRDLPATATSSEAPSNTASIAPTSTPDSSSGLSTGATVAIAVVIPVVVIAAFAAAFFVRRNRKKKKSPVQTQNLLELDNDRSDDKNISYSDQMPAGHAIQEMGADNRRHEIGAEERRYELADNIPVAREAKP